MSSSKNRWDEVVKQSEEIKKSAIILKRQALALMVFQITVFVIVTLRWFFI